MNAEYLPLIGIASGTIIPAVAALITSREASIPWQTAINATIAVFGSILMGFAGKLSFGIDAATVVLTLVSTLLLAKLVYRPTGAQKKLASVFPRGLGKPSLTPTEREGKL